MSAVSVFIFIVLVIKLIVDDCLLAPRLVSSAQLTGQPALDIESTMKLSNLLGQAVSVVVCIAKQANLSRCSRLIDVDACNLPPAGSLLIQMHSNCSRRRGQLGPQGSPISQHAQTLRCQHLRDLNYIQLDRHGATGKDKDKDNRETPRKKETQHSR